MRCKKNKTKQEKKGINCEVTNGPEEEEQKEIEKMLLF